MQDCQKTQFNFNLVTALLIQAREYLYTQMNTQQDKASFRENNTLVTSDNFQEMLNDG